jgi:aldehyde:ferredoxin oxidoreductase
MNAFGYSGKILHVDLESGHFEIRNLELDSAMAYLGGLGL